MRKLFGVLMILVASAAFTILAPENAYALDLVDGQTMPVIMPTDILAPAEPAVQETPSALTYIDISIDTQTLTYYVNGTPVLITPCVTGKPGRGTPRGVFAINSCVPGKYLNGPTWHVWVNRWMRFCGNVGIHDASWRKSFGGEIYKSNGSHGCVNIPHDQAVLLYSMVGVGTTVIVH